MNDNNTPNFLMCERKEIYHEEVGKTHEENGKTGKTLRY